MRFLPVPLFAATCLPLTATALEADLSPASVAVYVGTYTAEASRGIYLFDLDLSSGKLTARGLAVETENPSFLAFHPHRPFLYAVNEAISSPGPAGAISAFSIEAGGQLKPLNQKSSGGGAPCHLAIDPTGTALAAANYSGGSVVSYSLNNDGTLGTELALMQHTGSGPDAQRQAGPHAHSVNFDPAGRVLVAADLGIDELRLYRFDPAKPSVVPNDPPAVKVAPGAGPRHFTFHPNGRFAYLINELDNTIVAFAYDAGRGILQELQTIETLPEDFSGMSATAEILVHPSGKYLYGSNRGHDSISVFSVGADGRLSLVEHQSTLGKHPRNFGIDPTGQVLIVANRDSDNLVPFRIDEETGRLSPVGETYPVSMPVCVRFRR